MSRYASKLSLLVPVVLVSVTCAAAKANVLYDVQTYATTTMSGAAVLGTGSDTWNKFGPSPLPPIVTGPVSNQIVGQFAIQGTIISSAALVDSSNTLSSVAFNLSDAATGGNPVQNAQISAGSLGDYWYISGNYVNGAPNSADFLGSFAGLPSGVAYELVIYGAGAHAESSSISVTGAVQTGSGSFGGSLGYETFQGLASGGQIQFDIHAASPVIPNPNDVNGAFALFNGAQLLIITPEPATLVLFGVGAVGLVAVGRRQRRRKAA